ncbi:MAG: extracellular solute-binding protein [Gemmataceae bacterium]
MSWFHLRRSVKQVLLGILFLFSATGCPRSQPRVVLYCAQDQDFAEESLREFTQRTGIAVAPKFDTEADKSISLYFELLSEKDRPRCDVFWNNEILATIRLQRLGLLEPYDSPAAEPFPASSKAADHSWQAFANRARVLIVNTDLVSEVDRPKSLLDLAAPRWKGRVVMAKPRFGTSSTMAACLFEALGPEAAKEFYRGLKKNGVQIAPGNKQVAEWVTQGRAPAGQRVAVGITDTDDALEEISKRSPVAMVFPDRDRPKGDKMGTLFIPNTLAIIRGCPDSDGARKLVDYLLSPEVEARLAESASHQIPMNPAVHAKLPKEIETPSTVKAMEVDFQKAADLWEEAQKFLGEEFGP